MNGIVGSAVITAAFLISLNSFAQAPSGSTGECKDGTYTSAESKRGACAGHGGVKVWNASAKPAKEAAAPKTTTPAKATAPSMAPSTPAAAAAMAPATKSAAAPMTAAPAAPAAKGSAPAMRSAAAPGGGAGQVWVNTKSKVYHCPADKYYGKTKEGEYMSESAAKAAGNHADHGKACS